VSGRLAAKAAQVIRTSRSFFAHCIFCDVERLRRISKLAESDPRPIDQDTFGALAKELGVDRASLLKARRKDCTLIPRLFWMQMVLNLGKYRKNGIFRMIRAITRSFTSRQVILGYKVFPNKFGKIGVLICWDQLVSRSRPESKP